MVLACAANYRTVTLVPDRAELSKSSLCACLAQEHAGMTDKRKPPTHRKTVLAHYAPQSCINV